MILSGVGTENVAWRVQKTQPLLLFDKETTHQLLGMDTVDFEFDQSNPFRGFEMLAELMRTPSKEIPLLPKDNGQLQCSDDMTSIGASASCKVVTRKRLLTFQETNERLNALKRN